MALNILIAAMSADAPPSRVLPQGEAWGLTLNAWAEGRRPLPWLHTEVARRMAQRLSVIRSVPKVVIEWDALAGQSRAVLHEAYPTALWIPVEQSARALARAAASAPRQPRRGLPALAALARVWQAVWGDIRHGEPVPPDGNALAFLDDQVPAGRAQMLWSNLGLHAHPDPVAVLRRWHRVLEADGILMFSTLGPDTLRECRRLWADSGWGPPTQPFVDMHDLGDELLAAGFVDPVMDQEVINLTWESPRAALAELRTLGRNAHPQRHSGCRSRAWYERVLQALGSRMSADGRLSLSVEVVYGHAVRPAARAAVAAVTTIALEDMRRMVNGHVRPG